MPFISVYNQAMEKVVIPIAGLGTRLLPATRCVPKELMPLINRPLIHYIVAEALQAGAQEIILVAPEANPVALTYLQRDTAYEQKLRAKGLTELAESLAAFPPAEIHFTIARQTNPLGLGHAVLCAREAVGAATFGLMLPDTLLLPPARGMPHMTALHRQSRSNLVMTHEVDRNKTRSYGIIDAGENQPDKDGLILLRGVVEKPDPATAPSQAAISGRYILSPTVFDILADTPPNRNGELELTDAINRMAGAEEIYAAPNTATWHDCGNKAGLACALVDLALNDPETAPDVTDFINRIRPEKNKAGSINSEPAAKAKRP